MRFYYSLIEKFILKNTPDIGDHNQISREIWLQNILLQVPKNNKILDAGAGEMQYKKFCEHLNYTSQDFCEYNGEGNKKGLQTNTFNTSKIDIVSDITSIPVENESFDAVMCIEVLEHVPNPIKAIKELKRVLKPGGSLIITAPYASLTHFAPYHFASGYNNFFFEIVLADDFEIIEIIKNGNFLEFIGQETKRLPLIANQYSKLQLSVFDKFVTLLFLRLLKKLNVNNNSAELLCFGHHVYAIKK